MKPPKILAVASAIDLDFKYGCTPAWWQLWKGLHEAGVDLIVTPYRGRPVQAPWWRTEPNPCYREGELFAGSRDLVARFKGDTHIRRAEESPPDTTTDKLVRDVIWRWVTPRWQRHLERILEREGDVDAVVVFTVPMSHLRGVATKLRERFSVPIVFYDGDVPMSLPEFGGMDTGFNYYHGADPSEYDLVVSNSEGGLERLRELGARRAEAIFWGADPELFRPLPVEKTTRRLLLRLRGEVPRRLDRRAGDRAQPPPAGGRFHARRQRLSFRYRRRPLRRRRAVQRLLERDLRRAHQPQHHEEAARDRARVVHVAAVRAGHVGSGHRLQPSRGHRALVRAGS